MRVTVVLGPPGAGKSTHVEESRGPGDVVVDFDKLALALGATESHNAPAGVGSVAYSARQAAIARIFDSLTGVKDPLDGDAWVIAWTLNAETIADWSAKGAEFVVIDPGREVVLEQLAEAGRDTTETLARVEEWYAAPPVVPSMKEATVVKYKSAPIEAGDLDEGQFVGYASVFDNVDSYGDVVRRGAFAETLKSFGVNGAGIPCYWGHRMDDPMMNIGQTVTAVEDERGLKVTVQLDLDTQHGRQVHRLIKQGRVREMSFAYDVLDSGWVEVDGREAYELKKLRIHEVSVVPIGANPETELLAVKRGEAQATPAGEEVEKDEAEEPTTEEPEMVKVDAKVANARATIALAELGEWHTNRKD